MPIAIRFDYDGETLRLVLGARVGASPLPPATIERLAGLDAMAVERWVGFDPVAHGAPHGAYEDESAQVSRLIDMLPAIAAASVVALATDEDAPSILRLREVLS